MDRWMLRGLLFVSLLAACEPDETCVADRVDEVGVGASSSANWPDGPTPGGHDIGGFVSTCTVGAHSTEDIQSGAGEMVFVELSCLSAVGDYRPVELVLYASGAFPENLALYGYPGEVTLRTLTDPEIYGHVIVTDAVTGQDLLFAVGGSPSNPPDFGEHGRVTEVALECADPYTARFAMEYAGLSVEDSSRGQSETHFAIVEDAFDAPYDGVNHGPSGPMRTYAFFRLAE